MSQWHGGKGSGRRKEDARKFNDNWNRIFSQPDSSKPKGDTNKDGPKEPAGSKRSSS